MLAAIALFALAAGSDASPSCAGARIPEPWTSWNQSGEATAGGDAGSAPRLILGKPVVAALRPMAQVQFPVKPAEPLAKSYGGLFAMAIKDAARIGIGLSEPARVDIVSGSSPVGSVSHDQGPDCSGIREILWFDLEPGVYQVQISSSMTRDMRVMAADAIANQPLARPEEDGF